MPNQVQTADGTAPLRKLQAAITAAAEVRTAAQAAAAALYAQPPGAAPVVPPKAP